MAINYPTSLDSFTNPSASSLLTSPSHAQQHSDINDAMEAVQTKLAIGNTVIGTYTAYTPSFTNIVVGNGTLAAQYCTVNKFVHAFGSLTFGSTTTIGNFPVMSLPVNTVNTEMGTLGMVLGPVLFYDASAFTFFRGTLNGRNANSNADLRVNNVAGTYETNNSPTDLIPFTWTTSDVIRWNITYKAA
jgi:hypothetical protein